MFFRVNGCCKHVGAPLWHIEREVSLGKNKTCTSKPQQWSKPSKKVTKQYGPEVLVNIKVKKPDVDKTLRVKQRVASFRSEFDPRAIDQRDVVLSEKDLETLGSITNYNCGFYLLMKDKNLEQSLDITEVEQCVEVETSEVIVFPVTPFEAVSKMDYLSKDDFLRNLAVDTIKRNNLEKCTRNQ